MHNKVGTIWWWTRNFFGCIENEGTRKFVIVDQNNEMSISLLWSNLLTDYEEGERFQQNCAPGHKSRTTKSVSFMDEDNQLLEDWPAQSSDLNILKLL